MLNRPLVRRLLCQQDERRVWTEVTRFRQVHGQRSGQGPNVAGVEEVVGIDKRVQLIISFKALSSADAREYDVFVE